ncbi:CPBP family intramembrane glutamic endopeptidase [Tessaracoccus sp. MC1756]|uniref:CPBP family intramembrane glutamic endopeptidase n=1 Tax=Tessaracoccus sp. MC1756 TaxID=2760311 RepID=UPI0015FEFAB5|nr:CPBP family intramembrane glutamic endopeptidase [Tessaracoccus sp. MC1756]MBB1510441.1 CPBP family intramembrane metalloprotease [Tessaracoccus sp. MC1756]
MDKLQDKRPVMFAVAWIGIYIVAVNIGDWLSGLVGVPDLATSVVLVLLSLGLMVHLARNGWLRYYGVRRLRRDDFSGTLLYAPLVLIVVMQFMKGLRADLDVTAVLVIVVLMTCVGFLEELIFRGMLLRGIQRTSTLTRAIMISGVTFGIGHIVNLARGMNPLEQGIQIGFGVVLGIVLAMLFAVTGTIVPLIVFHALLNISGNVTASDPGAELVMLAGTTVVCAGYVIYLTGVLRKRGPSPEVSRPAPSAEVPEVGVEPQRSTDKVG